MSSYIKSPFKASPALLIAGKPEYVFGSWNDKTGPTMGYVKSNSVAGSPGTIGTLIFTIMSGNVPAQGSLITVIGCSNSGNFNVTNATILSVSCTDAGVCTVTYAISSTSHQANTADGGQVIIPQPEVGDLLSSLVTAYDSTNIASVPVAMPYQNVTANLNQALTVVVSFPVIAGVTATVVLQQAVQDLDSEYATVATVATVSGGSLSGNEQITVDPTLGRFFRLYISQPTAASGTIVGKILL
jgi:hypothetical protein